jgi:replicative DNA helicase
MNIADTITTKVTLLNDLVSDFVADTEAAAIARKSGIPRGPVTRLTKVDEAIGGYLAPGIHVIQAAPGAGKSAWCLQVAATCGFPALYVTAEMPPIELFRRLIARETSTFLGRLKSGEIDPQEAIRLAEETAKKVPHLAFIDGTKGYASPEVILGAAEALREKAGLEHILVVIDSLHIWARSARGGNSEISSASEYDLINASLDAASRMAADLACPILAVSHRNRAGQKDGGLHAGKGTGDIEYVAETVIELTPKNEQPDATGNVGVSLAIRKNRHGVLANDIPLQFCGRLQEFSGYKHGGLL